MEATSHIEQLRFERGAGNSDMNFMAQALDKTLEMSVESPLNIRVKTPLININLISLANDLYTKPTHFLLELI